MNEQWLLYTLIGLALIITFSLVYRLRRRLMPQSLSNRLPAVFILVSSISVVVVVVAVLFQISRSVESQKGEEFLTQAELNKNRLMEQIDNQVSRLKDLSADASVVNQVVFLFQRQLDNLSPEERAAYFEQQETDWQNPDKAFLRRSISFSPTSGELEFNVGQDRDILPQVIVTDVYGGLSGLSGTEPEKFYFGEDEWWQQAYNAPAENGYLSVGNPYLADNGEDVLVDIVMPLRLIDTEGEIHTRGVMRAKLRLNGFPLFSEDSVRNADVELALIDNINDIWLFSSTDQEKVGAAIPDSVRENIDNHPFNWGVDPDEKTGQNIIHSYARLLPADDQSYLEPIDLTIVLQQSAPDAVQIIAPFILPSLWGGAIALTVAVIFGFFAARQISRPIIALTTVAVDMAGGDVDQKAPVIGPTELQVLAQSFNSMTGQLRQILAGLEQQVADRTSRLEIVASLGEQLNAILKLEELLNEVVNQIQVRFRYYHAHIYLLDDEAENLVVAAGTGAAGVAMKAAGHSIRLDALTSLVAQAARSGEIVWVNNVRESEGWLPNTLLPDTYSEMAVPIILEEKVVGVLDVQEDRIAGLDEGDAALLRSLANQVAVAIRNARMFEEVQTALADARAVQRRFVEQAWDKDMVVRQGRSRIQFSLGESKTLTEHALTEARRQALTHKEPAIVTINGEHQDEDEAIASNGYQALVSPIILGETAIGNLQLHGVDPHRKWTENELALINAVVDQVAQTAENMRLLNETQERASREQLIGQVSDRLRRAPDIESLMQVAVTELSKVLDPDRAYVRFGSTEALGIVGAEDEAGVDIETGIDDTSPGNVSAVLAEEASGVMDGDQLEAEETEEVEKSQEPEEAEETQGPEEAEETQGPEEVEETQGPEEVEETQEPEEAEETEEEPFYDER